MCMNHRRLETVSNLSLTIDARFERLSRTSGHDATQRHPFVQGIAPNGGPPFRRELIKFLEDRRCYQIG